MSVDPSSIPHSNTLDVRGIRKPDKHPTIFKRYDELERGASFVLINDHDPIHLHDEFERDHPGSYGWEYLRHEPRDWQIRISKNSTTALPRVLVNTADDFEERVGQNGAAWSIATRQRDLDTNIIVLTPDATITAHAGPDVDVLIHILNGTGTLTTELTDMALEAGMLVFLPRRSIRGFTAGSDGLRYLTVHRKRESLVLTTTTGRHPQER